MKQLYELVSPDLVVDVVDDPNGSLWLITVSLAGNDSRGEAPQLLVLASNEARAQDVAAAHEAQWLSDTEEEEHIARHGRLVDFGTCSLLARPVDTPDLAQRLRDLAAGARSKADLIASGSPTAAYTNPVDVLRAIAKEAEKGLEPDPNAGLEIQRMLVVSTGHLPRQFREWLNAQNRCNEGVLWEVPPLAIDQDPDQEPLRLIVDPIEDYGWRVCVTEEGVDQYAEAVHSHDPLLALLRLAQKHNCQWLALDRDGDYVDGLATFED